MKNFEHFKKAAIQELESPQFEVTKQYLAVMDVAYDEKGPKISRINTEHAKDTVAIYFEVKDEQFFIVINISKIGKPIVSWVWIESGHRIYLTCTSQEMTFSELASIMPFDSVSGCSLGDKHPCNNKPRTFSRISYEPIKNTAYSFEEKLRYLLEKLEPKSDSVIALSEQATVYIAVCRYQYVSGNAGIHLDLDLISSLNKMGLELDIDTYIQGREIN